MVTHWLLIIFQKNDRLFNFVVKKNEGKASGCSAQIVLEFSGGRRLLSLARVSRVRYNSFFFIFERHAFRAVIFLVSVLDSEKKTESPTTTTTTTTCPKRMNEKGIIDCPWLMIFSNYFEKDEELAAAVVIHFK